MHLHIHRAIVFVSVFALVRSNEFKTSNWKSFNVEVIRREVNTSIIASSFNMQSVSQCAGECSRNSSKSLYFIARTGECLCNRNFDLNTKVVPGTPEIIYGSKKISTDCLELFKEGYTEDGVYTIQPLRQARVDTRCDMRNGGWTVVQRRQDGSENFYRGWNDYVTGFGNMTGEYWLGLDNIHALTLMKSEGTINFEAFEDRNTRSANLTFAHFFVDGPNTQYRLSIDGYKSTCTIVYGYNALENGMKFSTYDRDNDMYPQNCAVNFKGAWWYNSCHSVNINGKYLNGEHDSFADGVNFQPCWGFKYSLRETVLKVRRL